MDRYALERLICCLFLIAPYTVFADRLEGVSTSFPVVTVNQKVYIQVLKSGVEDCSVRVLFGDGNQQSAFPLSTPGTILTHEYLAPGTYTIEARGVGTVTPCNNSPQSTDIVVSAGPAKRPSAEPGLRPLPPGRQPLPPDRSLSHLPQIHDHGFLPASKNGAWQWAEPGVLAPEGRLYLNGVGFGGSGDIEATLPGGEQAVLDDPQWSDTQVSGAIPAELGGEPLERTTVSVRVRNADIDRWSPPEIYPYENPFAVHTLTFNDPAVRVVRCGNDGNFNRCNQLEINADDCYDFWPWVIPPGVPREPSPTPAITGMHLNCGTIGDDTGTDRYEIRLSNDWFIHRVVESETDNSSPDESVTISTVPTGPGVNDVTVDVDWTATPNNDFVLYWLRIEVAGPIGSLPF